MPPIRRNVLSQRLQRRAQAGERDTTQHRCLQDVLNETNGMSPCLMFLQSSGRGSCLCSGTDCMQRIPLLKPRGTPLANGWVTSVNPCQRNPLADTKALT